MAASFFEYRRLTRAHIAGLQASLDKARLEVDQAAVRVEIAERKGRQIAAERELWKHRALEAEAVLKSMGRER